MTAPVVTDVRSRPNGLRPVMDLADPQARDRTVAGSKAAALARLASSGLPVLPGVVLTAEAHDARGRLRPVVVDALRLERGRLSSDGRRPVIVRSSSAGEDTSTSSMAGRFRSILDVKDMSGLVAAVEEVFASAGSAGAPRGAPMAVLVQPQLDAAAGGVLFGIDPVTGDRDRVVVEVVPGGPEDLVGGRTSASRMILTRRGGIVEADDGSRRLLPRSRRRRLVDVAARVESIFGAPQDVEWAFDDADRLWVFQSRPVTTSGAAAAATGPILGPGPVAETFPCPLGRLERDLWVEPLRVAIVEALDVIGAVPRRAVTRSPVLVTVNGWAAADLELFGVAPKTHRILSVLNPAPPARRLAAAWRIGRLRRELPRLSARLVAETDARLASVPGLAALSDVELLWLLQRARRHLVSVHGHEVLAGLLVHGAGDGGAVGQTALAALIAGRAVGLDDCAIVARSPEVLALTAPAIGANAVLPSTDPARPSFERPDTAPEAMDHREALRLRTRWLQELTARASWELGRRLAAAGRIHAASDVRGVSLTELATLVGGGPRPRDLAERAGASAGVPLPPAFRLGSDGSVVPARPPRGRAPQGRGASPGRAIGPVRRLDDGPIDRGDVLVVRYLEPALATALPGLAALVSETGSTLSHLAILAREFRVPAVVAVPDALSRFPSGTLVVVDGTTGEVSRAPETARLESAKDVP